MSAIDSAELSEWMAYFTVEPFGEGRADLRSGIIAATVANTQRGKGTQPFKPEDFMPFQQPKKQSPRELFNKIKQGLGVGKGK